MTTFEVWAPNHDRVRLRALGNDHEMSPAGDGQWRVTVSAPPRHRLRVPARRRRDAGAGPALALAAGRCARSEPAARHPAYEWDDDAWTGRQLAGSVIYELHVGTFTPEGTFAAAVDRLDHLVELGVDLIEVLPVNAVNGTHNWGYDGVGWYAVHEPYGGPDGFKAFVDACHAARPRRGARRGLQPPRPVRGVPAAVRAVLQAGRVDPGATWSTWTDPAPTRCAATSWTTR